MKICYFIHDSLHDSVVTKCNRQLQYITLMRKCQDIFKGVIFIITNSTPYGDTVQVKLIQQKHTQDWLIEQVREKTGMYVDRSNLHKIFTGKYHSERIVSAINEILGI